MEALRFEGKGLEYFKIWIVNILLVLVTLGLYYPWAKVRNKRYFYANTTLNGRNFEYHATGKQLFVGYLIAMAIFIAYMITQQISPVGGAVVFIAFILALPWIIWRSMKFNMRMTSFSNVRFGFEGQLGGAYVNYMLIPIACLLALYGLPVALVVGASMHGNSLSGAASLLIVVLAVLVLVLAFYLFAFMKKRNMAYALNGSSYGQATFSTELETSEFAKIMLKTAGLGVLVMLAFMVAIGVIVSATIGLQGLSSIQAGMNDPEAIGALLAGGLLMLIGPVYLGMIIAGIFVIAYMYTRQRAYIYANSMLDDEITVASTLSARSLAWVMSTNFLLVLFTLGLGLPWASVRMANVIVENTQVNTEVGFEDYVTRRQEEQSALGEQIGDAFDVDVGIAI